ncbi:hypothetical protein ABB27_17270 [Stenotrophomonas terrae]|uniref:DUF998 domain-containing protein n=1 Tax=Stenotrophomonas terrae TaxID=405446 RepID=A0A0R0CAW3_9GAMM|nr:DUF998 domain-containing protein [Stenotrophomonas terrae]KRG63826.1 hypothetical protein ABB27_17270 [Stenotrophomonas terrae]
MDRAQLTRLLLVLSILYVIGFYFIGSAIKPGYSQLSNFVSEYNATGTAQANTLTFAGFLVTSVLLSAFLVSATPLVQVSGISRLGFWLLWSLPASFFLALFAPCDAGCPIEGSASQLMHNLYGIATYFGMGIGIALISLAPKFRAFKLRRAFMFLVGVAFPVVFVIMIQPDVAPWRGLIQRLLDVAMAVSLVLIAWTLVSPSQQFRRAVA